MSHDTICPLQNSWREFEDISRRRPDDDFEAPRFGSLATRMRDSPVPAARRAVGPGIATPTEAKLARRPKPIAPYKANAPNELSRRTRLNVLSEAKPARRSSQAGAPIEANCADQSRPGALTEAKQLRQTKPISEQYQS